jgi:hypothetical protein
VQDLGELRIRTSLGYQEQPDTRPVPTRLRHGHHRDEHLGDLVDVELDDGNRKTTTDRIATLRAELTAQGWQPVVTVKGRKDEDVALLMKTSGDDVVDGIVVTVIEEDRKAVLINVVGQIKAEQLAELGERFDIEPLKGFRLALGR